MNITAFIDDIIRKEGDGKFTNDPKDSGGPTRWGVTESVARENGYTGDMRDLPREFAVNLYRNQYWIAPGFHLVANEYPLLAERLLDFSVLAGQKTASKKLQRCLNVLNRNGRDFPDIKADGRIGPVTINSLKAFLGKRGQEGRKVILGMVASLQSAYLIELAERRPKDEEYQYGWQLNRAIGAIL